MFIFLIFAAAVLLEVLGTAISVIGLSSLFMGSPVVVTLAIALDFAKLVAVSFLYKFWKKISWLMRTYMTAASLILILITSAGAFGFLSGEFQKAISDTNTSGIMISSLSEEQGRLQKRKEEIDKQISQLKDDNVRGRTRLMATFGPEIKRINDRLAVIDAELPALKMETIKKNVKVGPIIYVAEAFNTTPEQAVKWVILLIIFVFDPLAIALLIAGNFLVDQRAKEKKQAKLEEPDDDITVVRASEAIVPPEKEEIVEPVKEVAETPLPELKPEPIADIPEEELATGVIAGAPMPVVVEVPKNPRKYRKQKDATLIAPVEEPIAEAPVVEVVATEEPKIEEEPKVEREVITIKQLKKPARSSLDDRPDDKIKPIEVDVIKSALDGLDDKFADIELTDEPFNARLFPKLAKAYEDEEPLKKEALAAHDIDAVTVGADKI